MPENFPRRMLDDPVVSGLTLRAKTFQNWATGAIAKLATVEPRATVCTFAVDF